MRRSGAKGTTAPIHEVAGDDVMSFQSQKAGGQRDSFVSYDIRLGELALGARQTKDCACLFPQLINFAPTMKRLFAFITLLGLLGVFAGCNQEATTPPAAPTSNAPAATPPPAASTNINK
jgi:hypothetical protein